MHTGSYQGRFRNRDILLVLAAGVVVGLFIGYVVMGTAHAIMEIGVDHHYEHKG